MSFWTRADRTPPCLVRLLARKPYGPPLTDNEIAAASGLSPMQVHTISMGTDWRGIDLPTMRAFLQGCGVDFENPAQMERVDAYLRCKPTWKYLRTSSMWSTYFEPLILIYRRSRLKP